MDFLSFLAEKIKKETPVDIKKAVDVIEETWGSIKLNKKILKHIAEDKDIEYDV
ncbi:hypothetical protein HZA55_01415 [Candidatus Poribacteria bacterium]|nr:hypothetical protein [Candidatus Poribacteria bacterium]